MAVKATQFLALSDVAAATHDQSVIDMAEVLNETNELLDDMHWCECNDGTQHVTAQRTGLPSVAWRELNSGVQASKSSRRKATDTTGVMEGYSDMDEELYALNGNGNALRKSEDIAFVEAMNQEFLRTVFYGNTNADQKKFLGLSPRYSDPAAGNGEMLVDAGGTGSDNTSIWLVGWGPGRISGLYPGGSKAGLDLQDKGQVALTDENGGTYYAYRTQFKWKAGLTMPDWRYAGRICNIDVSELDGAGAADLIKKMIVLSERVKSTGSVRQAWYCSRRVRTALRLQILAQNNVNLSYETISGKKVLAFDGIPVRQVDSLLETEDAVTGTFING